MQISKFFLVSFFLIGCSGATEVKNQGSESRQENNVRIQNTIREINAYLSEDSENQSNILLGNASEAVLMALKNDEFDYEKSKIVFFHVSEDEYSPGRLVVYWIGKTLLFEELRIDIGGREYRLSIPGDYREYLSKREDNYFDGHAIFILDPNLHEVLLGLQRSDKLASIEMELIDSLD